MPKAPILDREALVERLPDGTLRSAGFNIVNTSLGAMIEPSVQRFDGAGGFSTDVTASDESIDRITVGRRAEILRDLQTTGLQTPTVW